MKPIVASFVHDIFDDDQMGTDLFVEADKNGCKALNITKIMSDRNVIENVVFRCVWNAIFKMYPSFGIAHSYFQTTPNISPKSLFEYMANIIPLFKFLGVKLEDVVNLLSHFDQHVSSNPEFIKMHTTQKLVRRYAGTSDIVSGDKGIFNFYCELKNASEEYEYKFKSINTDVINRCPGTVDEANYITGRLMQSPAKTFRSVFDAMLNTSCRDSHMSLCLAGALIVHVDVDCKVDRGQVQYILDAAHAIKKHNKVVLLAHPSLHVKRTTTCNVFCMNLLKGIDIQDYLPSHVDAYIYVGEGKPLSISKPGSPDSTYNIDPKTLHKLEDGSCVMSTEFLSLWLNHQLTKRKSPHIDFALEYYKLARSKVDAAKPFVNADNAIVFVDNRPNIMTAIAVKISINNLQPGRWTVVGFVDEKDVNFYRKYLGDEVNLVTNPEFTLARECFSLEFYNDVFKSPSFWSVLEKFNRVLMVQDDGFVVSPGMEDEFLMFDYVGAPWCKDMPYNTYLLQYPENTLVGNGGLSLRNPKAMKRICEEQIRGRQMVHFDSLQVEPEDVFFARACKRLGYNVPTYEHAQKFATEEVMCIKSFGFHKLWGYNPEHAVAAFFSAKLAHVQNVVREQQHHE